MEWFAWRGALRELGIYGLGAILELTEPEALLATSLLKELPKERFTSFVLIRKAENIL